MKSFNRITLESFDQSPTGDNEFIQGTAQPETPEQPLVTAGYAEAPFSGQENYSAEMLRVNPRRGLGSVPVLESREEGEARELWNRIYSAHNVQSDHEKTELLDLNAPATESNIHQLESRFHTKLSTLLVELLKIHNGQRYWMEDDSEPEADAILPHGANFFSTDIMLKMSTDMMGIEQDMDQWYGPVTADPRIKAIQWSPKWLVLGANEDNRGVFYVLDFDPTPQGKVGQAIKVDLSGNERVHLGDSFEAWFRGFVNRLSHHTTVLESAIAKPPYPLAVRKAIEEYVQPAVVDEDALDALANPEGEVVPVLDSGEVETAEMTTPNEGSQDYKPAGM